MKYKTIKKASIGFLAFSMLAGNIFAQCDQIIFSEGFEGNLPINSYPSDLTQNSNNNIPPLAYGTYAIVTLATDANPNFDVIPGINSNFFIADGSTGPGPVNVWDNSFTGLVVGQTYTFRFWAVNVNIAFLPATLSVNIGGTPQSAIAGPLTGGWTQYSWTFLATATNATIEILQGSLSGSGNDFGIDEISLTTPIMTANIEGITCTGECNGSGTAFPVNASGSITYVWNTNPVQTTQTITGLCSGKYAVTLTNSNGCTAVASLIIDCPCIRCNNVHNDCPGASPIADQDCFWSTGGNSSASVNGNANFIGTTSNNNTPFRLYTHGTERMRITEDLQTGSGMVGIGTPNPTAQLHIFSTTNNYGIKTDLGNGGVPVPETIGLSLSINRSTNHVSGPWYGGVAGVSGYIVNAGANQASMGNYFIVKAGDDGRGFGGRYLVTNTGSGKASTANYGVLSQVEGALMNVGYQASIYTDTQNPNNNFGFSAKVSYAKIENTGLKSTVSHGVESYGVYAKAFAASQRNFGVYGETYATPEPCAFNVGIYGIVTPGNFNGCSPLNTWAGYFEGDVNINGDLYLNEVLSLSDKKLKNNLKQLHNPLENILKIKCYSYQFKREEFSRLNLPEGEQIGVVAQELKELFPNLVKEKSIPAEYNEETNEKIKDSYTILTVNYTELIPLVIGGMQEQEEKIKSLAMQNAEAKRELDNLKDQMNTLKDEITTCCSNYDLTKQELNANQTQMASLEQNKPNPFTEATTINYYVPSFAGNAVIKVYSLNGVELKSFAGLKMGKGQVIFNGGEFQAGTYVYTLFVDGKQVDSKWMMLTR